jgi:O-antigen/teichoic acid export membrane protein
MYLSNIFKTIASKAAILIINFLLVIITTHLWGTEGRGMISILIADISIIAIFNNVLGGSSVSFFTPKLGVNKLIMPAYLWIFILTPVVAITINILQSHGNLYYLMILAVLNSLVAAHYMIFAGKENFKLFNIFSLLVPILTLVFILLFVFIFKYKSVNAYIFGFSIGLCLVWLISFYYLKPYINNKPVLSFKAIKDMMSYGWQTELSYFLHFLSYRLSYYFILHYMGMSTVGIFSVGIALAESIWLISRSIATVQFAKIINSIEKGVDINITKSSVKLSMISSLIASLILIFLPSSVYSFVFGHNFFEVKKIMLFLFPGIVAIAISNIYGHYFSATGQTKTLIVKSFLGLLVTIGLSIILIPKWGIMGACITASLSYMASSGYLLYKFYTKTKFNLKDFTFTWKDMQTEEFNT